MSDKNTILQTFYHRMMPLYTPQAEKFLETAEPNLFSEVSFRYTFSVEAMTKISHIIEDAALANPRIVDLHVSFQTMSRLLPQQDRYRQLATHTNGLWVYGEPDTPADALDFLSRATLIDTGGTSLTRYWYVVVYGPGLGMTLVAEEIEALDGNDRYYEGFYTFEQDVAYQVISILHNIFPKQVTMPAPPEQLIRAGLKSAA